MITRIGGGNLITRRWGRATPWVNDPRCVLYAPFWALPGSPIISADASATSMTVTGATYGPTGRTFDGIDDKIDCGANFQFTYANSFTIGGWFYCLADSTDRPIAGNNTSTLGYNLRVTTANKLRMIIIHNGTNYRFSDSAALSAGWHFGIGISDAGTVSTFVDGVSDTTVTTTGNPTVITPSGNFLIGDFNNATWFFKDVIDEVWVFNAALSAAEVLNLYNATGRQVR